MIFHGYFRSSAAWRCRIAFNLKGIQPELKFVHLRRNGGEQKTSAFRRLNPLGLVPALETDQGVLTESLAIIEWLDETHPDMPRLLPDDPFLRARVRAFAQIIASDIHPLQNLRVLDYLKSILGQDQAGADAWCQRWIGDGLAACEKLVREQPHGGAFCFGDMPGLADICLIPQLASADRFGLDISQFSRLVEIGKACAALPAFADAHAARQPDSE